ncbi:hypothetical protein [Nucisporomicrobium flavum]|uniref:hypothetical protein n=1 Tax=Nucisporomicrobium flavum TaxID=2785915 RepID=UPI001F291283|nr:hypothetical protein [Nucisporomicrobium flavum]
MTAVLGLAGVLGAALINRATDPRPEGKATGPAASAMPSDSPIRDSRPPSTGGQTGATQAAGTAALNLEDRFAMGDYSAAWELFVPEVQQAISRADYVRIMVECGSRSPSPAPSVKTVRMENENRAVVELSTSARTTLVRIDGEWRSKPSDEVIALWATGADNVIREYRNTDRCRK